MRLRSLPLLLALVLVASCSLINKPDEVRPGPGAGGEGASNPVSTSTGVVGCTGDPECASLDEPCKKGVCDTAGHVCVAQNIPAGAACGNMGTVDCNAPDTCDDAGACQPNAAPDGAFCGDCPAGPGKCKLCEAGACQDCAVRATTKTFRTPRSLAGWSLTGGWGVYEQTPPSYDAVPTPYVFSYPVLGTDGNRVRPYPGSEVEQSSATSPPTTIPSQLTFLSWSYDEGSHYDQKSIAISVDNGASYTTVAICTTFLDYPFCHEPDGTGTDVWTPVTVDLSAYPQLVGHVGLVKLSYQTLDAATGVEKGWYVDQLDFATDCACGGNADCAVLNGDCAMGACDATNSECKLIPQALGGGCGENVNSVCSAPDTCDAYGFCNPNDLDRDGTVCDSCTDGSGRCTVCVAGTCNNCPALQDLEGALDTSQWVFTGGWNIYYCGPTLGGPGCNGWGTHDLVVGVDGTKVSPYWNGDGTPVPTMRESGTFTTPTGPIPAQLTFDSWNQDRGGMSGRDTKRIRVSVDGGASWTVLVDCQGLNNTLPFCTQNLNRALDDWDSVSIDTGAAAGMNGIFEFAYDSQDSDNGSEIGWYLDNLDIMRCGGN